jgi:FlaA1/EpsC-like NDP-sugar epimerase
MLSTSPLARSSLQPAVCTATEAGRTASGHAAAVKSGLVPAAVHRSARTRYLLRVGIDLGAIVVALCSAFVVRFETLPPAPWTGQLLLAIVPVVALRVAIARAFGIHRMSWRLHGLRETERLAAAIAVGSATMLIARLLWPNLAIPVGVIALEGMFTLGMQWGVRALARAHDEALARAIAPVADRTVRALLVGAGRDGRLAGEQLRASPQSGYEVVGFLDDAPERQGQYIAGIPVLGRIDDAATVAARTGAEALVLTMPAASRAHRRDVVERCRSLGLSLRTVPAYWELLSGRAEVAKIREVKIEDLLGREVVGNDRTAQRDVVAAFRGKRVLVTGAGGSIGSELCRQIAALEPAALILFEYGENNLFDIDAEIRPRLGDRTVTALADIRDAVAVQRLFAKHRPEVVFHAAAYKHVPMMESHPTAAVDNNVRGTRNIVDAAHAHGVGRFVFVSTDKAVNPTNVMGATKRAAEMIVQAKARASGTKMCCVRFGNVLGSRGSVLHTFRRQIEAGGPVTVTHPEMTRFFMTIPEAVRLVMQAGAAGRGGEVFLLDMGEPVRIADMAAQMIRLAGHEGEVALEFVGLRPGEKLYEELIHDGEAVRPSEIEGINIVTPDTLDAPTILPWVARLEAAADRRDGAGVRRLLAHGTGYRPGLGPVVVDDDPIDVDLDLEVVADMNDAVANAG